MSDVGCFITVGEVGIKARRIAKATVPKENFGTVLIDVRQFDYASTARARNVDDRSASVDCFVDSWIHCGLKEDRSVGTSRQSMLEIDLVDCKL